ncbi:hypothetical protein EK21DRAFT_106602 [Setomelanomma holmii]|uniref:Uncharacterized protein n=1 Tax=Setomelanomma holmii TaxID=210430 RepID=A0A9P4HKL8_9PLEO|nr:hypothetical protein EK21DRAFT_106602 [Setomelanomma holmii]
MPAFLRRLKRSLQSRSRRSTRASSPLASPPRAEHLRTEKDNASDEDGFDSTGSLPPLPVIKDRGPPTANRYSNADIFWNSTMIEADDDEKLKRSTPKSRNLNRRFTDRSNTLELGPVGGAHPRSHLSQASKKVDSASISQTATPKRKVDNNRGLERLHRSLSYGRERTDNDLTVMAVRIPDYARRFDAPTPRIERLSESLSPRTQQWDEFMDFPFENSKHIYAAAPDPPLPVAEQTASLSGLTVISDEKNPPDLAHDHHVGETISRVDSGSSAALTWNLALNQILGHEAVDPAVEETIRERIRSSRDMSGSDQGEPLLASITEAGLVPNFSYPVAAAAYYDRLAGDQTQTPAILVNGVESKKSMDSNTNQGRSPSKTDHSTTPEQPWHLEALPNGISSSGSSTITDSLYRPPTIPKVNGPSTTKQEGIRDTLPNKHSSRSSSAPSSGSSLRPPSPTWTHLVPTHVRALLTQVLTPSELSLCNAIMKTSSVFSTPPTTPGDSTTPSPHAPQTAPNTSTKTPHTPNVAARPDPQTPALIRLAQKLHTLLHHLQDRTTYLEASLLPILGNALENKTLTIDVLSIEIQHLGEQVQEMKSVVDYGNRVLSGCWVRENEVWRTVGVMRECRERKGRGLFRRLTGRKSKLAEGAVSSTREGAGERSSIGVTRQMLTDREVDALMLMAQQNVQILREDVDEMVERVERCRGKVRAFEGVECEEGSWRDV